MKDELVKYATAGGVEVAITPQIVREQICATATDQEIGYFLAVCSERRMNPFTREVYLVKYKDSPAAVIVGKDYYMRHASECAGYRGYKAGVVFMDRDGGVARREGSAVYGSAGESLLGGWAEVYVEGREPVVEEVSLKEYDLQRSLWKSKPGTMIRKVALVQAMREAFPGDFNGLYDEAEAGAETGEVVDVTASAKVADREPGNPYRMDAERRSERLQPLRDRIRPFAEAGGMDMGKAVRNLQDYNGVALEDLTDEQIEATCAYMDQVVEMAARKAEAEAGAGTGEVEF